MEFSIIVACTKAGGIAKDGAIPWNIPEDIQHFRRTTLSTSKRQFVNAVIMGRRTWESLHCKPLKGRVNIVVSTTLDQDDVLGAIVVRSFDHAHFKLREFPNIENVFVIGGERLYKDALYNHRYTKVYLTLVNNDIECDTFFPIDVLHHRYSIVDQTSESTKDSYSYSFITLNQKV